MSDASSAPVGDPGDPDDERAVTEAATAASDAFGALGNETRMDIIRALFEAEREAGAPVTLPFSTLFETSDERTTAGFAYHLRQLPGTYVEKVDAASSGDSGQENGGAGTDVGEGYRLTAAGRRAARAVASGALTESVDRAPLALDAPCPFCGEAALRATGDDTVLTVGCGACDREVLALPFPPAGYRSHDDGALPAAVDRYYRGRIATMRDGTCPECGGPVETVAELVDDADDTPSEHQKREPDGEDDRPVARARMTCDACGYRLHCPVTLTLLEEPAVVAAFHGAGIDLAERPLWNVGSEWRERVVSTDPLAVRVTARVDDTELACFVARDLSVVYTDHASADDDPDGEGGESRDAVADAGEYPEAAEGKTEEETGTGAGAGAETDAATA